MKKYKQKSIKQLEIDRKCGCECHTKQATPTQNFYWCMQCTEKHTEDIRYSNPDPTIVYEN